MSSRSHNVANSRAHEHNTVSQSVHGTVGHPVGHHCGALSRGFGRSPQKGRDCPAEYLPMYSETCANMNLEDPLATGFQSGPLPQEPCTSSKDHSPEGSIPVSSDNATRESSSAPEAEPAPKRGARGGKGKPRSGNAENQARYRARCKVGGGGARVGPRPTMAGLTPSSTIAMLHEGSVRCMEVPRHTLCLPTAQTKRMGLEGVYQSTKEALEREQRESARLTLDTAVLTGILSVRDMSIKVLEGPQEVGSLG